MNAWHMFLAILSWGKFFVADITFEHILQIDIAFRDPGGVNGFCSRYVARNSLYEVAMIPYQIWPNPHAASAMASWKLHFGQLRLKFWKGPPIPPLHFRANFYQFIHEFSNSVDKIGGDKKTALFWPREYSNFWDFGNRPIGLKNRCSLEVKTRPFFCVHLFCQLNLKIHV